VSKEVVAEEKLFELAVEAGAEDVSTEADDAFEVYTTVQDLAQVSQALEAAGIGMLSAEISRIPQNTVMLGEEEAVKLMRLLDSLEEHDDVQKVYANFDMSPEVMEKLKSDE
jgi:transcriptional/translational regulatory protein YebC/TACO1